MHDYYIKHNLNEQYQELLKKTRQTSSFKSVSVVINSSFDEYSSNLINIIDEILINIEQSVAAQFDFVVKQIDLK